MAQFHLVGKLCVCVVCVCIIVALRRCLTNLALPQRMVQVKLNQLIARGYVYCFRGWVLRRIWRCRTSVRLSRLVCCNWCWFVCVWYVTESVSVLNAILSIKYKIVLYKLGINKWDCHFSRYILTLMTRLLAWITLSDVWKNEGSISDRAVPFLTSKRRNGKTLHGPSRNPEKVE